MEYSPKKMKELLEKHGFSLKKKFGQNFIVDENIINSIISKSEIDKDTLVIEIGPGAGSLTYKLAKASKNVLCYEIDTTLKEVLKENINSCDNVEVIYQDFLQANVLNDLSTVAETLGDDTLKSASSDTEAKVTATFESANVTVYVPAFWNVAGL